MAKEQKSTLIRFLRRVAKTKLVSQTISELEKLASTLNISEQEIIMLYLDLKNTKNKDQFAATPYQNRVLLLPQCLRSSECKAELGEYGYECKGCGKCGIRDVKREAESIGYRVFILPGGSMVERVFKRFKPKACLGVACLKELVMGICLSERFNIIPFTIPLLRDGCVNTNVDWLMLRKALYLNSSISNVR
ncbi:MAG: DUF116 domain-containing protein [Nitrososphaerales archaeon]